MDRRDIPVSRALRLRHGDRTALRHMRPNSATKSRIRHRSIAYARARVRAPRLAASLRLRAFCLRVRAAFLAAALRFSGPWRRRSLTSPTTELRSAIARLATFGLPAPLVARVTCLATFLRTPRALRVLNRSVSVLAIVFLLGICSFSLLLTCNVGCTPSLADRIRDRWQAVTTEPRPAAKVTSLTGFRFD